jgi:hypothetical protein
MGCVGLGECLGFGYEGVTVLCDVARRSSFDINIMGNLYFMPDFPLGKTQSSYFPTR